MTRVQCQNVNEIQLFGVVLLICSGDAFVVTYKQGVGRRFRQRLFRFVEVYVD